MTSTGTLQIVGRRLPGRAVGPHRNVHLGVQRRREVVDLVAGDSPEVRFDVPIDVTADADGAVDFRGPFAQGKRGGRFVYLSWGDVDADGVFSMFSRAKLNLFNAPDEVVAALAAGRQVQVDLALCQDNGKPIAASIPPSALTWSIDG